MYSYLTPLTPLSPLSSLNCTSLWQPETVFTVFTASTLEQFAQLCHCLWPRFVPRSTPVWWGNAMQSHNAPGILESWNLNQTISILALTLTSRLITLVIRIQKAGLFIWSTKFRYVNSGILVECCHIEWPLLCSWWCPARSQAEFCVLISWNSALWGCDSVVLQLWSDISLIYQVSSGATETSRASTW